MHHQIDASIPSQSSLHIRDQPGKKRFIRIISCLSVADREEHAKDKLLSPVDPDARLGKKTSHTWPGYKAHIVMEEETGIITGVETTPANATDGSQLQPMLKEQEDDSLSAVCGR